MAKIYDAQIQWQAPSGHRFQAQPLEDYISAGLANVSRAAGEASEGIQKLHDQDAAALMEKADKESKKFVEDFEDFSGDNYMGKMEAGAMKFWDDAYAQLDEPTKRRFDMYNPKAREIFEVKTKKAAVEKTFSHQHDQYKRRVPIMASQIVALGDPNLIKKALAAKINELSETSNMRAGDLEEIIDSLRLEVADGAIAQAIGEGRLEDAAALNNDLDFSSAITPTKRASNNVTIQNTLNEQQKAKKEVTEDKKRQAIVDSMTAGAVNLYDAMYAFAGQDTNKREAVIESYNKFLNDFLNGNIQEQYNGVPVSEFFPELKMYMDAPSSIRQEAFTKIRGRTLENNPVDKKIKTELGYRAAALAASIPTDDDDYADLSKVTPEKMADIFDVLDRISGYYSFDTGVQKQIDKLVQLRTAYRDRASLALRHSAYQDQNTLINQKTGLGWETQKYLQSGNLAPDTMDALRKGIYKDTKGVVFNSAYRDAMLDAMQNFAYWTNGGKLPESGSYEELAMMEIVALNNMSESDKKLLGIENITPQQFVDAWMTKVHSLDAQGVLKVDVPDNVEVSGDIAEGVAKSLPGVGMILQAIAPQSTAKMHAKGAPLEETPWYQSMLATVKYLNGNKQVDTEVLGSYAAANRSTQYKDGTDRAQYMKVSRSARHAASDTRAYQNPEAAGAYKIKVNK